MSTGNKIIIIGGSGFIGTRLCQKLTEFGIDDFLILDKKKSVVFPDRTLVGDVRNL